MMLRPRAAEGRPRWSGFGFCRACGEASLITATTFLGHRLDLWNRTLLGVGTKRPLRGDCGSPHRSGGVWCGPPKRRSHRGPRLRGRRAAVESTLLLVILVGRKTPFHWGFPCEDREEALSLLRSPADFDHPRPGNLEKGQRLTRGGEFFFFFSFFLEKFFRGKGGGGPFFGESTLTRVSSRAAAWKIRSTSARARAGAWMWAAGAAGARVPSCPKRN